MIKEKQPNMGTKAYTQTLHGEDIFKKVISDYEKDSMISSIALDLPLEEAGILFWNKIFHQRLQEDPTFKSYFEIALQQNMEKWKLEDDVFEKFQAFKISQHFIQDSAILQILNDFEESIAKK